MGREFGADERAANDPLRPRQRRLSLELLEGRLLLSATPTATIQPLHDFTGVPLGGGSPRGGLTLVGSVLYGTTISGGTSGAGTLFSMNPDGSNYQIIHTFTGGLADGSTPGTSLSLIGSVLYGTTGGGGSTGRGTIFSINVDGSNFQVLHSFSIDIVGSANELSYSPSLGVVFGTTTFGGTSSCGTIFSMKLDGSGFQVLYSFPGGVTGTQRPIGSMAIVGSVVYGVTHGYNDNGAVFSINADGSNYKILHHFTGGASDGSGPEGGLTAVGSTLYGTTGSGGSGTNNGTIFSLSTDGSHYQVLRSFAGSGLAFPGSDLTVAGSTLYGSTGGGVFSISTSGANFMVLGTFPSGYSDSSALTLVGTTLLGTTSNGGPDNDGSVFSMNLDGSNLQFVHYFPYASHDGSGPQSDLTLVGNVLYGTTLAGGTARRGTLFSMNLDGSNYQVLHSFTGGATDGLNPGVAGLAVIGSVLYGTTAIGGPASDGTIFSVNLDGSNYQVLHSFTGSTSDGANPLAGLTPVGSVLFGTTELGGPGNTGTIFSINADGSNFQIVHSGGYPVAPLTLVGSTLYGTTAQGGSANNGAVFSMNSDGSNYQVLYSFPSQPTLIPGSKLTVVGSTLYGMTGGGTESYFEVVSTPAIFSLNLDGSNFQILHTFAGGPSDGSRSPLGSLTVVGSMLFGTALGGPKGNGIVFSMNDDGSNYQIVYAFAGGPNDGSSPYSSFVQVGTTLYGTTIRGRETGGMVYALTLPAPQVASVQVASSSWNADFLNALQAGGKGNGTGYAIPAGSPAQLRDLPWTNLNQIQIAFNENVDVQENSLAVTGQNGASYGFSGFTYNPTTFVATWTLASPIGADTLSLNLRSSGAAVVTNVLGTDLDGEWTDSTSNFPSGDGTVGGDFNFGLHVLSGDLNQDGIVNTQDLALVTSSWLSAGTSADGNGDGIVNSQDLALVASQWLTALPSAAATTSVAAWQDPIVASATTAGYSEPTAPLDLAFSVSSTAQLPTETSPTIERTFGQDASPSASAPTSSNIESPGHIDRVASFIGGTQPVQAVSAALPGTDVRIGPLLLAAERSGASTLESKSADAYRDVGVIDDEIVELLAAASVGRKSDREIAMLLAHEDGFDLN